MTNRELERFVKAVEASLKSKSYKAIISEVESLKEEVVKDPSFRERLISLVNNLLDELLNDLNKFDDIVDVFFTIAKKSPEILEDYTVKSRARSLFASLANLGDWEKAYKIATLFGLEDESEFASRRMFEETLGVVNQRVEPMVAEAFLLSEVKKYSSDMVYDYLVKSCEDLVKAQELLEKSRKLDFAKAVKGVVHNTSSLKRISQMVSIKTFFVNEEGVAYDTGGLSFLDWAKKYIRENFEDVLIKYGPIPEGMDEESFLLSKGWSTVTVVCTEKDCRASVITPQFFNLNKVVHLLREYKPEEVIVESYPSGITRTFEFGEILERF